MLSSSYCLHASANQTLVRALDAACVIESRSGLLPRPVEELVERSLE